MLTFHSKLRVRHAIHHCTSCYNKKALHTCNSVQHKQKLKISKQTNTCTFKNTNTPHHRTSEGWEIATHKHVLNNGHRNRGTRTKHNNCFNIGIIQCLHIRIYRKYKCNNINHIWLQFGPFECINIDTTPLKEIDDQDREDHLDETHDTREGEISHHHFVSK
jgi:hypothetical protein